MDDKTPKDEETGASGRKALLAEGIALIRRLRERDRPEGGGKRDKRPGTRE